MTDLRPRRVTGQASDAPGIGRRRVLLGAGLGLVGVGLAGGGYVAWELLNDPLMDPAEAARGVSEVEASWQSPDASDGFEADEAMIPGKALGLLRIPAIRADYEVPIVYGITPGALHRGVGWFETTARPGEVGNFAVAGHRGVTGPFVKLPELMPGARIEVETADAVFGYSLDNHPADLVVDKTETWVLQPVPGKPDLAPTQARITLITCASLIFDQRPRAVAFGHLVDKRKK